MSKIFSQIGTFLAVSVIKCFRRKVFDKLGTFKQHFCKVTNIFRSIFHQLVCQIPNVGKKSSGRWSRVYCLPSLVYWVFLRNRDSFRKKNKCTQFSFKCLSFEFLPIRLANIRMLAENWTADNRENIESLRILRFLLKQNVCLQKHTVTCFSSDIHHSSIRSIRELGLQACELWRKIQWCLTEVLLN